MARIEVEESALDSIKAMNQRLREKREWLLFQMERAAAACVHLEPMLACEVLHKAIAECNSSPKVME